MACPLLRDHGDDDADGQQHTDDLGPTFTRVAQELHSQYVVGFAPSVHDGKLHELEVRVRQRGMTARARKTYIAPSAP